MPRRTGMPGGWSARRRSGREGPFGPAWIPGLAALLVLAGACTDDPAGAVANPSEFIPTDYEVINGFHFTQTVDGVRNAEIVADSTHQWVDSAAIRMFGVQMNFFDSLGVRTARATSQTARLESESRDLELQGNAVLDVLAQNTTIQSPVLYYSPEEGLIRSDTVTRAVIDGDAITGTSFSSDLQFRNVTITRPVGAIPDVMLDTDTVSAPPPGGGTGDGRDPGRDDRIPGREDRDR